MAESEPTGHDQETVHVRSAQTPGGDQTDHRCQSTQPAARHNTSAL